MTGVGDTKIIGFNTMTAKIKIPVFKINKTQITNNWRLTYKSLEHRLKYKDKIQKNDSSMCLFSKGNDQVHLLLELRHLKILSKIFGNIGKETTIHQLSRVPVEKLIDENEENSQDENIQDEDSLN